MHILRKSAQKLKNKEIKNFTPYDYLLPIKIETSWAKKVVKAILETWNTNDAIVDVWFIHSRIKKFWKHAMEKMIILIA